MSAAKEPISIWRASLQTRHFDFEALGTTEREARAILIAALGAHAKQYFVHPDTMAEFHEDIFVDEMMLGAGYRDRQLLVPVGEVA